MIEQRKSPSIGSEANPARFAEYAAHFDDLFARTDQRECFGLYLRGLLTAPERKNVEAIASAVSMLKAGVNLGQALQHFVTDSPWDHNGVLGRYRAKLPAAFRESATSWVIHDGVLLKKGRNSVGTQRQFARSLGRKVNCQIAVVVGVVGLFGYVPLAMRLYLPSYWLREYPELAVRTVPSMWRVPTTKQTVAISFLDELRAEGWNASDAAVEDGYAVGEFVETLAERGISQAAHPAIALAAATESFDWLKLRLGLDHFEGRTWVGWHHHATMVLVATGFLLAEAEPDHTD